MKKVAIFLFIIMMVIFLANEVEAIGIGVTTLTGDFHYEEDRFSYTLGVTPYLLMGYKVNNNLSVLLSGKGSYHLPDKYISEKNGELEIADGDLIYLQILLNTKYNFRPDDTFQPYIKAGVGGYNFYGNIKAKNESEITLSISRPGAKLGLGLGYEIKENLRLSLESSYNYIDSEQYRGDTFNLIFDLKFMI